MKIGFYSPLFLAAIAFAQPDSYDSGGPLPPEQAAYDVTLYELSLTIDPASQSIAGSNSITARVVAPITRLLLDFEPRYTIDSVLVEQNGRRVPSTFIRQESQISIDLLTERSVGSSITAKIFYQGQPRIAPNPPWDGGFSWNTTPDGQPWVSVSCENNGADIWWPCKDHPSDEPDSMAINLTVPRGLFCVSNGRLRRIDDNATTRTFHWFVSTPINNYGVSFYLAPFVNEEFFYKSTTGEVVPMQFYYLPEDHLSHREFAPQIPQHVRFFEELLGPYPFRADKYAAVQAPYLGMEHQTCIAYGNTRGNGVFGYDQGFDALHFHELAHEWWGNMLTAADWKDMWLHEGFATYMEALYAGYMNGQPGYETVMAHFSARISNSESIAPERTRSIGQIYGGDIYYKGAWVLHTLRYLVGDELFFASLQRFLYPDSTLKNAADGSQCRLVSTDEFITTVENVAGRDLGWFFQVYLRQARLPVLQTWLEGQSLFLKWKIDNNMPFPLNVPVKIGDTVAVADMSTGQAVVELNPFVPPQIDPENRILKQVEQVSQVVNGDESVGDFQLAQNYPNPFNGQTTIAFTLPASADILLSLFNVRGEKIAVLAQGRYEAGVYRVEWDSGDWPSGIYTYKLEAGDFRKSKSLILLK